MAQTVRASCRRPHPQNRNFRFRIRQIVGALIQNPWGRRLGTPAVAERRRACHFTWIWSWWLSRGCRRLNVSAHRALSRRVLAPAVRRRNRERPTTPSCPMLEGRADRCNRAGRRRCGRRRPPTILKGDSPRDRRQPRTAARSRVCKPQRAAQTMPPLAVWAARLLGLVVNHRTRLGAASKEDSRRCSLWRCGAG